MGQLCSCARAQDIRGRNWVNNTILSRSPSAKSSCYISNVDKQSPDGVVAPLSANDVRPRSQQSSFEESGVYSKSSSADDHSTASYGATHPQGPRAAAQATSKNVQTEVGNSNAPNEQTTRPSVQTSAVMMEKSSSLDNVTVTSPARGAAALDLKVSISLQAETGKFSECGAADRTGVIRGGDLLEMQAGKFSECGAANRTGVIRGGDLLEMQAHKVRSVLQRTVELMASEIDSATLAEYVQRSRPDLELTEAEWSDCCNPTAVQDLIWDVIIGPDQKNYDLFCSVIASKVHLQPLFDLLQTLDSLIALVSPDFDDDDDDDDNGNDDDLPGTNTCDTCRATDSSDFDLDLVFCHRDVSILPTTPPSSNLDDRSLTCPTVSVDCSSLSLAGSSYLPSVTGDELGQLNVPMLTLSLINYCLCRRERASLLRRIIEQSSCIRELSLVKTHVNDDDLTHLLQSVSTSSSLVRLDLRLSCFGNDAAENLGRALRHNSSLRFLNVASTGLTDVGCSRLMTGLVRNRSLSDLDIGFNDIRDTGCHAVADALSQSNPLRKVRMRDNGITCYGASALFQSLARNFRLSFLDISSNGIGNDSMHYLSEALISNRTLRELNLENCRISAGGCIAVARALRANTALRCLQLSLNPITDVGLEALADGLRYNHAVETLSVNMCNIGNLGFLRLLDALRFNYTLKTVKLCYNNIGGAGSLPESEVASHCGAPSLEDIFARLYEALHYNPKLKVLLWGNNLERCHAGRSLATGRCLGDRTASFSNSSNHSPILSLYRQDVLVSV